MRPARLARVIIAAVTTYAILATLAGSSGMPYDLMKAFADAAASISYVDMHPVDVNANLYVEFSLEAAAEPLVETLRAIPGVVRVEQTTPFSKIYGKRIIVMGGGAQVGQVALGAITEADRHNIRGERISVDTIPLVGEQALAEAVRAVARLPRAKALVLAGSLMGGEIETAVREVRAQGLLVISLNMAGSVPDAADLVVTDPVQAGVMTVMAIADTAKFSVERLQKKVFYRG